MNNIAKLMSGKGAFTNNVNGMKFFATLKCVNNKGVMMSSMDGVEERLELITNTRQIRFNRFGGI
jgi:hypothetical protein